MARVNPKTAEALVVLGGGLWTATGLAMVYSKGWQKEGATILVAGAILAAFVASIRHAST
jgi:hypothetical protein